MVRLKNALHNLFNVIDIVHKTARGIDYRTLNKYILKINELHDINEILFTVSRCLKSILNYELFGFAIKNGDSLDAWVDPRMYKDHFVSLIHKDFNCQKVDNMHFFDVEQESFETKRDRDLSADILSFKVTEGEHSSRLYILPRRRILAYHHEIINVIITTVRIVLDKSMNMKKLESAASIDPLTNCYNRRALESYLDHDIAVAHRYGGELSVIMFDIDHFKKVNDTHGHQAGDAVLREIPQLILPTIRKSDHFARYGGEEFVLVLPNTKHHYAAELAERIRERIQNHKIAVGNKRIKVTASFGVASLKKGIRRESLLKEADKMLYRAKANGRNLVMPQVKVKENPPIVQKLCIEH